VWLLDYSGLAVEPRSMLASLTVGTDTTIADTTDALPPREALYKSLKVLGRPVEYVRYPDAGHDLSRSGDPLQRIDRLVRIYEFMERFIDAAPQSRRAATTAAERWDRSQR